MRLFESAAIDRALTPPPERESTGMSASFRLEGMSCAGCAARIEKLVRRVPGIFEAHVSFASGTLFIRGASSTRLIAEVTSAVRDAGYKVEPRQNRTAQGFRANEETQRRELLWLQIRLAVALFFGMSAMLPSIVVYLGAVNEEPRVLFWLAVASGMFTTPVLFFSGWPFLSRAVRSIRQRAPGMDLLVAAGALATFAYSVAMLARGSSAVYFDTASGIITFLLVGRLLEALTRRSSLSAVSLLHALSPRVAHVVDRDGRECDVDTESVAVGARVLVRPGERVPLDGRVLSGASHLDCSLLTGEFMPTSIGRGDTVEAGTLNQHGALLIEVTHGVGQRSLDRIASSVDQLLARRAPMQALADRVAANLTMAVLSIASLTAVLLFFYTGDAALALMRAVAVLVIACPCALGLATPMAVLVAAGRAAGRGILFQDAATIERAADVTTVFLDKTGTLTRGHPVVVDVFAQPPHRAEDVLSLAAIAEAGSEHPVARAIVAKALPKHRPGTTRVVPGQGVLWRGDDAHRIAVGTRDFLESLGVGAIAEVPTGSTVAHVASNDRWVGAVLVADAIRPGAATAIVDLKTLGVRVALVTGDRQAAADEVAGAVGIDEVWAACLPEAKAHGVSQAQQRGEVVAFVGDGLNDGPALAAADVGFAVEGATDVARAASGVTLRAGGVERLVEALVLARATRRVMRQNLAWAVTYNAVAIPGAIAGFISPAFAALAMAASSLSVIANSLRLTHVSLAARGRTGRRGDLSAWER